MGLTLTSQIKTVLQRVKTYSVGHIAELAQTVSNLLEEVDKVKADKPQYIDIIIPATGWQTDSTVTGYTHYLDIPISNLTENDEVAVTVVPASKAVADAARFTATESLAGVLRLRAANVPSAAITAQYHISAGYIPAEETEAT